MITIETNIDAQIKKVESLPKIIFQARKSALNSVGFTLVKETKQYISTGGRGSWEKPHPMSTLLRKKSSWSARNNVRRTAYEGLERLVAFKMDAAATSLQAGLGNKIKINGIPLEVIAQRMISGYTVPVSESMRRMFGATKGIVGEVPGVSYFPLKKTTLNLVIPARKMSILDELGSRVTPMFSNKLEIALEKRLV